MNLEENIARMEQELAEMKAKLNGKEKWEPKGGEWIVGLDHPHKLESRSLSKNFGIEFETKQKAEKAYKYQRKIHRLYKLAEELNEGWEPDWNDSSQAKFLLHREGDRWCYSQKTFSNYEVPCFKSPALAQKAIDLISNHQALGE